MPQQSYALDGTFFKSLMDVYGPAPTGTKGAIEREFEPYRTGPGAGDLQGPNTFVSRAAPGLMASILGGRTEGFGKDLGANLPKYNAGDMPGYSDIFRNFRGNVQRELGRNLAGIRESLGTRGAAYSSAALRHAGRARAEATERIIGGAAAIRGAASQEFGQRFGEAATARALSLRGRETDIGELASRVTSALGIGQLAETTTRGAYEREAAERDKALGLYLADYLRNTGTPEGLDAFANFALNLGQYGEPATVIS